MNGRKNKTRRSTRKSTRSSKQKTRRLMRRSKNKMNRNITLSLTLGLKQKKGGKHKKYSKKMRGGGCGMMPFIGAPYNAADAAPNGNYLPYNPKVEPWPEQSNAIFNMRGGFNMRGRKKKSQKGGGFFSTMMPDELVNIGRSIPATMGQMYDRFNGSVSMPSSHVYPTDQPLAVNVRAPSIMSQADLLNIYNNKNNIVSRI